MNESAVRVSSPQPEPVPNDADPPPIPLAGVWLRLYRIAERLGIWNLRTRVLFWWNGGFAFGTRFFDPFEGPRIAWAMAPKLAADGRDHLEIAADELPLWLSSELTSLPEYDSAYCFRSLYRSARRWRIDMLHGDSGTAFFGTTGGHGKMVFDIYYRRGVSPTLTISQRMRFNERKRNLEVITPQAIRDLYTDALSQAWSEYQP
jgi:hypothetical protein